MSTRRTVAAAIAALTLATALAAPGIAQARGYSTGYSLGYGGLATAGVIGGLALGAAVAEAAPRRAVIVEHRYVRKGNRLHECGCVVRTVPAYPW